MEEVKSEKNRSFSKEILGITMNSNLVQTRIAPIQTRLNQGVSFEGSINTRLNEVTQNTLFAVLFKPPYEQGQQKKKKKREKEKWGNEDL